MLSHFSNVSNSLPVFSSDLLVLTLLFTAYLQRFSEVSRSQVSSANRKSGIHVAWTTITYRSVALLIMAALAVFFIVLRVAFPQFTENSLKAGEHAGSN